MTAESEEDDRLDALIDEAGWCPWCQQPIGYGDCDGCIPVSCSVEEDTEEEAFDDR